MPEDFRHRVAPPKTSRGRLGGTLRPSGGPVGGRWVRPSVGSMPVEGQRARPSGGSAPVGGRRQEKINTESARVHTTFPPRTSSIISSPFLLSFHFLPFRGGRGKRGGSTPGISFLFALRRLGASVLLRDHNENHKKRCMACLEASGGQYANLN